MQTGDGAAFVALPRVDDLLAESLGSKGWDEEARLWPGVGGILIVQLTRNSRDAGWGGRAEQCVYLQALCWADYLGMGLFILHIYLLGGARARARALCLFVFGSFDLIPRYSWPCAACVSMSMAMPMAVFCFLSSIISTSVSCVASIALYTKHSVQAEPACRIRQRHSSERTCSFGLMRSPGGDGWR